MSKCKIGLVVGDLQYPRLCYTFARLAQDFIVSAYVVQREGIMRMIPQNITTHLFQRPEDGAGFLKELEAFLWDDDIIVSMDFNSMAALQAARVAQEAKKPFFCYCSEADLELYAGYQNITAIHNLLFKTVDCFLVPGELVRRQLLLQGVEDSKILTLLPGLDLKRFVDSQKRRSKFRHFLKFSQEDKVILYYGSIEKDEQPELLLNAVAVCQQSDPAVSLRFKVIFVGNGSYSRDLQYLAYQLGLGNLTYFLSQDTERFHEDLLAAADVIVYPRSLTRDSLPSLPYILLEAMASGVVPLVARGSLHAELVALSELQWCGDSHEVLALALKRLLADDKVLASYKEKVRQCLIARLEDEGSYAMLQQWIFALRAYFQEQALRGARPIPWKTLEQQAQSREHADVALSEIGGYLNDALSPSQKSLALCLQAEALKNLNRYDEASSAFESALKADNRNVRAYAGLGYLAWHSYNHEEAMIHFKKGLSLSPEDPSCLMGVGMVYKRLSMSEDALFWLEKSMVMGARGDIAAKALVQAACQCRDIHYAIITLERVSECLGENIVIMRCLGQLYLKAGFTDTAHQLLNKYLLSSPA